MPEAEEEAVVQRAGDIKPSVPDRRSGRFKRCFLKRKVSKSTSFHWPTGIALLLVLYYSPYRIPDIRSLVSLPPTCDPRKPVFIKDRELGFDGITVFYPDLVGLSI